MSRELLKVVLNIALVNLINNKGLNIKVLPEFCTFCNDLPEL